MGGWLYSCFYTKWSGRRTSPVQLNMPLTARYYFTQTECRVMFVKPFHRIPASPWRSETAFWLGWFTGTLGLFLVCSLNEHQTIIGGTSSNSGTPPWFAAASLKRVAAHKTASSSCSSSWTPNRVAETLEKAVSQRRTPEVCRAKTGAPWRLLRRKRFRKLLDAFPSKIL